MAGRGGRFWGAVEDESTSDDESDSSSSGEEVTTAPARRPAYFDSDSESDDEVRVVKSRTTKEVESVMVS